jgi:hypothetical protein
MNWAVTAYLSGGVLAAGWLVERLRTSRAARLGVAGACLLGVGLIVAMHYPALARPAFLAVAGPPTEKYPLPLRRFDPTCRLRGWRALAAAVDELRAAERGRGEEPVVAAAWWTLPGLLGVYCDGHPPVYSLGLAAGDRRSQYDLWRPNPLWDPDEFRGRTFVLVGDFPPAVHAAFESVEPVQEVSYAEDGSPVEAWRVTVGRGYRGLGPAEPYWRQARH